MTLVPLCTDWELLGLSPAKEPAGRGPQDLRWIIGVVTPPRNVLVGSYQNESGAEVRGTVGGGHVDGIHRHAESRRRVGEGVRSGPCQVSDQRELLSQPVIQGLAVQAEVGQPGARCRGRDIGPVSCWRC
jgi:hypothetical protein